MGYTIFMITAKQNQKFPFHFLSAPPPHPTEENKKGKENFWFLLPRPNGADEARRLVGIRILLKMRSDFVVQREPVSMKPKIRLARSARECGGSGGITRIQKDFQRFFRRELQSPFREKEVPCSPNIQNRSFASQSFFCINEREAIIPACLEKVEKSHRFRSFSTRFPTRFIMACSAITARCTKTSTSQ